ncbi:AAA family ATPase [Pyrobaculum sp.]|uniref:AAA family ATPase n=1 Tax=Pyrobaculum sp. TaxID=2004705 RepID=UPI003D141C4C
MNTEQNVILDENKKLKIQIKDYKRLKDVVIEGKKIVLFGPNGDGKSTIIKMVRERVKSVYIDVCRAYGVPVSVDACRKKFVFKDPELVESIIDDLRRFRFDWSIYYNKAYRDKWLEASELSFGELRALLIISAVRMVKDSDTVILIDAFEAGLHYDWIVAAIDILTEIPQPVIIESHMALTLKAALSRGWSMYYILVSTIF